MKMIKMPKRISDEQSYYKDAIRHRDIIEDIIHSSSLAPDDKANLIHHISKMWMNLSEFIPDKAKEE